MALTFYPHPDDAQKGSLTDQIEILMEAAERYRAFVMDATMPSISDDTQRRMTPRDQQVAYNWEEIARVLREVKELPEVSKSDKLTKGGLLSKLAEIYEVLRAAKMSKLEAVRLALVNEANQLRNASQ